MAIKIDKKIVSYNLVSEEDKAKAAEAKVAEAATNVVQLGEPL
ncbi:MAG TPA: NrdJb, partial [Methylotenera mobilis]|nr:NrdJb [Methylotenera mobilis]